MKGRIAPFFVFDDASNFWIDISSLRQKTGVIFLFCNF